MLDFGNGDGIPDIGRPVESLLTANFRKPRIQIAVDEFFQIGRGHQVVQGIFNHTGEKTGGYFQLAAVEELEGKPFPTS